MATQFEIDCALMAGRSYQSSRDKINWLPAPSGWQEFSHVPNSTYQTTRSFEASAFQNTTTGEIVISYAGTAQLTDWIANVALGLGFNAEQLNQAALYYLQIRATNPNATISFTGHSLGGGLAALLGVFFDEKTVTFDQAPFGSSVSTSMRDDLISYLNGHGYDNVALSQLAPELLAFSNENLAARHANVSGLYVEGEILSEWFSSMVGVQTPLLHGPTDVSGSNLHAQSLLTAFVENDQFREVTNKLTDLLGMIFGKNLYFRDPNKLTNPEVNFLEHLIRHQEGVQGSFAADAMLDRFTFDLQLIAQDGGLTMANNDLTKALTAFAMQAYYFNRPESNATLFDAETDGIHFDRMDVADTLEAAKGYTMYFSKYLDTLPANDRAIIEAQLPNLLDWYIQAGTQAMNATAGTQRAFMLGGSGDDTLTGGSQDDLLEGNDGKDILYGGSGVDTLYGGRDDDFLIGGANADLMIGGEGIDYYFIEGHDTIRDSGRNFIVYNGQILAGGFVQVEGAINVYRSISNDQFTLTFNSPGHLALSDTDSITFENQTSAADFANGDFGMRLFDHVDADVTWSMSDLDSYTVTFTRSDGIPVYVQIYEDGDGWYNFDLNSLEAQYWKNYKFYGNGGNDVLFGMAGQDYISGGIGDDRIFGDMWFEGLEWTQGHGAGDFLYGDAGRDYISGGWGDDLLSGGADDDFLSGGEDNDTVAGDGGNDLVLGGIGNDQLLGGAGNDILFGDGYIWGLPESIGEIPLPSSMGFQMTYDATGFLADFSFPYQVGNASIGHGDDFLAGGEGNDWLAGGGGSDTLLGEAGNDHLDGGEGDDYLDGGDGNDILWGDGGADSLFGGAGNDRLKGEDGDDSLDGGLGDDALAGGNGNDTLLGGKGNDTIFGEAGNDIIDGGAGDDYLDGGDGDDVYLFGRGSGHDTVFDGGSIAGDTVRFTNGVLPDEVALVRYQDHLVLSLNDGSDILTLANWFTSDATKVERFEFANGSVWDVSAIIGKLPSSALSPEVSDPGNPSPWVLDASGTGVWVDNTVFVNLPLAYQGTWVNGLPLSVKSSIDVYTGYWLGAQAAGSSSSPVLENKYIWGSVYGDYLYGGLGDDILHGMDGNDYLSGDDGHDQIYGDAGQDQLFGGYGDDYLYGGEGDDFLDGGPGIDSLYDVVGNNVMYGGAGNDELWASSGNDTLAGGAGNDTLKGGGGANVYLFGRGDGCDYIETAGQNFADETNTDILRFAAGVAPGDIIASSRYNYSYEWGGFEYQNGEYMGTSRDLILTIQGTGDSVTVGGWFTDRLTNAMHIEFNDGTVLDKTLLAQIPLVGTDQDDKGLAANLKNLALIGGDLNDVLDGRAGNDALYGGYGNDVYLFGLGDGQDTIYELWTRHDPFYFAPELAQLNNLSQFSDTEDIGGIDAIRFKNGIAPADLTFRRDGADLHLSIGASGDSITVPNWFAVYHPIRIERMEFADGTVWDADQLMDLASGAAGDVVLTGTAGADILTGTAGNDTLQGGAGNDLLAGGDGNDTYIFNPGDGVDRIVDSSGTDTILFGDGITPDSLSLGLGSLLIRVGDQDDAIHIEDFNPGDPFNSSVVEQFQFGDGTVLGIGDLLARGFDIQGTEGDDLLTGTAITDRITGGDGNDTLAGGKGDDLLAGGGGNDTYMFNLGDGQDTIEDVSSITEGNLIAFGAGITASDLAFVRDGADLLIQVGSQGDTLRLKDFDRFGNNGSLVANTLQFADGSQASLFALTNTAPVVGVMPENQTALEDAAYSFTIPADTFTDADGGDSLTYSATLGNGNPLPAWLTFDPATQIFSGTPANGDVGILDVTVMATDTAGASAIAGFALNIVNVNDAPMVAAQIPTQSATEDAAFSFTIPGDAFTDVDPGDSLTYSASLADASALPAWLTFDPATQTLSGTPENGDVTTLNITVTATDSAGASVAETFAMEVVNTNDAPIAMADTGFVGEDNILLYSGNVLNNDSDVDAETILGITAPGEYVGRYGTLSIGADGGYTYSLDNGSGEVQALAEGSTVVDHFTCDVSDGIVAVSGNLDITVIGTNDAPVVSGDTASTMEDAAQPLAGNVLVNDTDIDNNTVLAVANPGAYQGNYGALALAADGSYSYNVDNSDNAVQSLGRAASVTEHFTYTATDGITAVASTLNITLTGSNDAPLLIAPLADRQVKFNKDFSWQVPAGSFADPDQGDTLEYSATLADGSALPSWLSFDAATQAFSGRAPKQTGSMDVKVTATDKVAGSGSTEGSLSTSDVFRVTVSHGNEGVGNGEDAPPPGHDGNCNDGFGAAPGKPGRRGGRGGHDDRQPSRRAWDRPADHDDVRFRMPGKGKTGKASDDHDAWHQPRRGQPSYLNASHWEDKHALATGKSGAQVDPSVVFGRWLTMDLAVSKALAEKKTLSWLDERLGAETTVFGKESAGFLGSTTMFGPDLVSLQAGYGQELKGFKGLAGGVRKVA